MITESTPSFTEKDLTLYDIHELDGKNLRISIGEDIEDGERAVVVFGSCSDDGMHYVLGTYKTEEKGLDMTDEKVFKLQPMREWEPGFDLQQSFGLAMSHGTLQSKGLVSTEDYRWAKKRFWDILKEEVDNHLKGEE